MLRNAMLRVRSGRGRRSRVVPIHPELADASRLTLSYGTVTDGRLVDLDRSTAWRWVQAAVGHAEDLGTIPSGRRVGTHTASQLRGPPPGAWDPDQLPVAPAGTQLHPDDSDLPGADAGPDRKPRGRAVVPQCLQDNQRGKLGATVVEVQGQADLVESRVLGK